MLAEVSSRLPIDDNSESTQTNDDPLFRLLIRSCLWPGLLRAIRLCYGSHRLHILRLLKGFIRTFLQPRLGPAAWFAPLTLLAHASEPSQCFYSCLESGTLNRQVAAMHHLALFLRNPATFHPQRRLSRFIALSMGPGATGFILPQPHLRGLIQPIIFFYLNAALRSSPNDSGIDQRTELQRSRLLDHCIEALGSLASHLTWPGYHELLSTYTCRLTAPDTKNISLAVRCVVILLDNFQSPIWSQDQAKPALKNSQILSKTSSFFSSDIKEHKELHDISDLKELIIDDVPEQESEERDLNYSDNDDSDVSEDLICHTDTEKTSTHNVRMSNSGEILSHILDICKRLQHFLSSRRRLVPHTSGEAYIRKNTPSNPHIGLAVSLVALLRRLPKGYLESRLPTLLLRIIEDLRPNRNSLVAERRDASQTLCRLARMLGPGICLDRIFQLMEHQLCRGYAAKQVRLFVLHRCLAEVEIGVNSGNYRFEPGQLDFVGALMSRLYFDEAAGELGEEMDSRRVAGQSTTSIAPRRGEFNEDARFTELGGINTAELPEARGFKAPEGLSRLVRLLSPKGLESLFLNLEKVTISAARGLPSVDDYSCKSKNSTETFFVPLRFRKRALTRLEVVLEHLPTRRGCLVDRHVGGVTPLFLACQAERLAKSHLKGLLPTNLDNDTPMNGHLQDRSNGHGWVGPRSNLLAPRWDYLTIQPDPGQENLQKSGPLSNIFKSQSHLLVRFGLVLFYGLIRLRRLSGKQSEHLHLIGRTLPLLLECLKTSYVRVLGCAIRCLHLIFILVSRRQSTPSQKSNIRNFLDLTPLKEALVSNGTDLDSWLQRAGDELFRLLGSHAGLMSTKTAAKDPATQLFASSLFSSLASFLRHQPATGSGISYHLSSSQLACLFNSVDLEISRQASVAPALSLLLAILQLRLRDSVVREQTEVQFAALADIRKPKDVETASVVPLLSAKDLVIEKIEELTAVQKKSTPIFKGEENHGGIEKSVRLIGLVEKLKELAINSPSESVRASSRHCLLAFLFNYSHRADYLHEFVGFFLAQIEHKKPAARLSTVAFLTGLISELPVSRLLSNSLHETLFLTISAGIIRDGNRPIRAGLLAIIRLLFVRLPPQVADNLFQEFIIPFCLTKKDKSQASRLLGLQLVSVVLDAQSVLALDCLRDKLINILAIEIIPMAAQILQAITVTQPSRYIQDVGHAELL
ncbi:unnamed protein product, partial [Protopolystoma xenopodis]